MKTSNHHYNDLVLVATTIDTVGIGGVTVHIERLMEWLNKDKFPFTLCNYKTLSMLKQINIIRKSKVVHIHVNNSVLRVFYSLLGFCLGKKTILTIHGDLKNKGWFCNMLDRKAVTLCTVPVVINQHCFEVACKWNKSTKLMSAFIPPAEDGFLPQYAIDKIHRIKSSGLKIVATNAYSMVSDSFGNEIYGIKFLVEFFKNRNEFLFVSDPSGTYRDHFGTNELKNVFIIPEKHSFYAVIQQSDIVIRATSTDGDSLSVREAMFAGKPIIATDVVDRPQGVIKFKYNDVNSLEMAMNKALENKQNAEYAPVNVVDHLQQLYIQLIGVKSI